MPLPNLPWKFKKKTSRLVLRPYEGSDFEVWREGQLGRSRPTTPWEHPILVESELTRAAFKKRLSTMEARRKADLHYQLGVFLRKTGQNLGTIDFAIMTRTKCQNGNLGYSIYNQFWRQGFAHEAAIGSIPLAFRYLKLHRLEAAMELKNIPSQKVARSVGMQREGVRRKFLYSNGDWLDLLFYMTTAETWGFKNCHPIVRPSWQEYL